MTTTRRHLRAFGLTIRSEFEVPELPPAPAEDSATVTLRRAAIEPPPDADPDQTVYRSRPRELLLLYDAGTIAIRDGREIRIDPDPAVPAEILRHLIVGPVLNFLLYQRGYFVLHASTVEIDGQAVAFVGDSGTGKTTTATACLCAGHRVLSDDVAALDLEGDRPRVVSGYPSIKLDPDLVDQLDVPVGAPQGASPDRDRHFHRLRHDQPTTPVPLARIYRLEDAPTEEVEPVESSQQVLELVRNTYTVGLLDEDETASSNFERCSTLAASVPVKRLRRRREIARLPDLVDVVEEDLDGDGA